MLIREYGADVSKVDKFRAPPLHRAAPGGYLAICELLLDHGADIDAPDCLGATALHQACGIQPTVVKFLLGRNANPSIATAMGETPLHSAVNSNNADAVDHLLRAGCAANAQDNDQATPLFRAINKGYYNIAYALLEHGADVTVRSSSALQEALTKSRNLKNGPGESDEARDRREEAERMNLVKALLDSGAQINAQGGQHGSALQAACTSASPMPFVDELLDRGANPNLIGGEFGCALSAACYFGRVDVAERLLRRAANPDMRGGRFGSVYRALEKGMADDENRAILEEKLQTAGLDVPKEKDELRPVDLHDDDVWRLTPAGWTWLPPENREDVTSAHARDVEPKHKGGPKKPKKKTTYTS